MPSKFPLTVTRAEGPVFALDAATIERGVAAAKASPRRRIIMQLHRSDTEGVQRMLNFMQRGSYARPHCHPARENIETVCVLKGSVGFLVFEPTGTVRSAHRLDAGTPASCLMDIEPGVWHTIVPLADDTVILEIKRGPYNAATDKSFAAWAPEEGSPGETSYLRTLEATFERLP
jgi:cupin fold WbuC family metalloprotein